MEEKKQIDFSKQGKKNRAAGQRFESKVRAGLEEMGLVVSKWMNTLDYNRAEGTGKIIPSKRVYNPFKKAMIIGSGFPDFIAYKIDSKKYYKTDEELPLMRGFCDNCKRKILGYQISKDIINCSFCNKQINSIHVKEGEELLDGKAEVIGIEVKKNGYLDKVEKDMCYWLLDNKVFSRILIAKAKQNGRKIEVEYIDFLEKYKKY